MAVDGPSSSSDNNGQEDGGPAVSIAVGVTIAILASFVQSLGLTIQRKSHLQNESFPLAKRRRDWQRPLWLVGFIIFISSNILGSVFQLASLSIVILAPLGAVSLLWNAFFARILLGDLFSRYLIIGTILIAGGAVLIAIFGVVPEITHSLEDLLALYARTSFIVWITLQFVLIAAVLGIAHWSEARLENRLQDVYIALPTDDDEEAEGDGQDTEDGESALCDGAAGLPAPLRRHGVHGRQSKAAIASGKQGKARKVRRWSTPPAYLSLATEHQSPPESGPPLASPNAKPVAAGLPLINFQPATPGTPDLPGTPRKSPRHVSFGPASYRSTVTEDKASSGAAGGGGRSKESTVRPRLPQDRAEKMRLWLGIAYGSASGTMSGLCLLFAKTGAELLILTVMGKNQFKRWESWMIVLALLVCALAQLWYLNKSLRLAGPTLICPLAFCFYNLSSIFNGLMYFDQWSQLSGLQDGLMSLGIIVLLAGVWVVSIKSSDEAAIIEGESIDLVESPEETDDEEAGFLGHRGREGGYDLEDDGEYEGRGGQMDDEGKSPEEETFGDLKSRIANLYQAFLLDQAGPPRGFSVGISASSPGFAIRPQQHHHDHHHHHHQQQRRNTAASIHSPLSGARHGWHSHSRSDDFGNSTSTSNNGSTLVSPTALMGGEPRYSSDGQDDGQLGSRPSLSARTTSEPGPRAAGAAAAMSASTSGSTRSREQHELALSYRHRRKRSLAGDIYVGASDPFSEQPAFEAPPSPGGQGHGHGRRRSSSAGSHHRPLSHSQSRRTGSGADGTSASTPATVLAHSSTPGSPEGGQGQSRAASSRTGIRRFLPWTPAEPERVAQD